MTRASSWERFLGLMQHKEMAGVKQSIRGFIKGVLGEPAQVVQLMVAQGEYYDFIDECVNDVLELHDEANEEEVRDGIQKLMMTKLHPVLFKRTEEDRQKDAELSAKMDLLRAWIKPEHVDMDSVFVKDKRMDAAQKHLANMNTYKGPMDKLICIINACQMVNAVLEENQEGSGKSADTFLPALIYSLIFASPPNTYLNVLYISNFCHPSQMEGHIGYWFTHFFSAVSFVENIDANSLSVSEEEYQSHMTASPGPTKEASSTEESAQTKDFKYRERHFDSLSIAELREVFDAYKRLAPSSRNASNNIVSRFFGLGAE